MIRKTQKQNLPKYTELEFREIYCSDCKRVLGKYNVKYYSDAKIAELLKISHESHIRDGHKIDLRKTRD
ncbi:MAG: hypothetical protein AABX58_00985 [Thermoproteota archaeon]